VRIRRDFTDVRDVIRAYELLLARGDPGEAYNVASGHAISIGQIVRWLVSFASRPIRLSVQQDRIRPDEARVIYGSSRKLHSTTGWKLSCQFQDTLRDLFGYWRRILRESGTAEA
jgi:GDP-4-dehydro-6-deoxy-D-mannose reductase